MSLESLRHFYLRNMTAPLLRILGPNLANRLAQRLARGIFEMNGAGRQIADQRVSEALPTIAQSKRSQIVSDMYDHLARYWVEMLFVRRLCRESSWRDRIEILDADFEQRIDRNRGCIIAGALLGNPVMCAFALGQLLGKVHVLIDLEASPVLAGWHRILHGIPRVELISRSNAAQCIPGILEHGGALWMIAEANRRHGHAVNIQFLGGQLRAYPTIARLAKYYEVPIMASVCTRKCGVEGKFKFELQVEGVDSVLPCADEFAMTGQVLGVLERMILAHPDQYLWNIPIGRSLISPSEIAGNDQAMLMAAN